MRRFLTASTIVPCAIIAAVAAMVVSANIREGRREGRPSPVLPSLSDQSAGTSRDALEQRIVGMQARVAKRKDDVSAVVLLADALIRQSRITGSVGPVMRAQALMTDALREAPAHYDLLHMQGTLYLSQHKFSDAIVFAERCRAQRPDDASVYGILGDARLELGDYDEAFAAFDHMMQLRPSAASYARVSYARELQGDLAGALESMRLAADATGGGDMEGLAWTRAQMGEIELRLARPFEAMQQFALASQAFPGHPFAVSGYAKALDAQGRHADALALLQDLLTKSPTPDLYAQTGDLLKRMGRDADAERDYALAEAAWRSDAPEPKNLARFLAERGVKIDEAVTMAEGAAVTRHDIFTEDALAWAYFKAGRIADAKRAMALARRTGSRDHELLRHAAAIDAAPVLTARRETLR